jgi:hypothetical protein
MAHVSAAHGIGLSLVVLDNFYANVNSALGGELFLEMVRMRASAYRHFYSDHYLPSDSSDLIGTHYLLCAVENERLVPQCGFRHVTLDRCDAYGIKFPILQFVEREGVAHHREIVDRLIARHRATGTSLVYGSNIAIRRPIKNRRFPLLLRELSAGILYSTSTINNGFVEVTASTVRTRTEVWFAKMGFRPFEWSGSPLEAIPHPFSQRDTALLMEFREPTAWARECFEKHRDTIDRACWVTAIN